jgi:hypothetical protein
MANNETITIQISRKVVDAVAEKLAQDSNFSQEFYTERSIKDALVNYLELAVINPDWLLEAIVEDDLLALCEPDMDAIIEVERSVDAQKQHEDSMGGFCYLGRPNNGWTGLL